MNKLFQLTESNKNCVPDHFQCLIESILEERARFLKEDKILLEKFRLENDYIFSVLVTVAVECGFRLECFGTTDFDIRALKAIRYQPNWRDVLQSVYRVEFYLTKLKDDRFKLLVVPVLDQFVLVNFLSLQKSTVVRSSAQVLMPGHCLSLFKNTIAERFLDLPSLARAMRNFLQREKDIALNLAGESNPSLLGLPEEIKRIVLNSIPAKDFVRLTATCKSMNAYKEDHSIWRQHLNRDFNIDSEDPYNTYVGKFVTSKVVVPAFRVFDEDLFPFMLHRSTSSTSLATYIHL